MGHVYILENESMPGLVKIGQTTRPVEQRVKELNTTGVPTPFKVIYIWKVDDSRAFEQQLHRRLRNYRRSKGREFFSIGCLSELGLDQQEEKSVTANREEFINDAVREAMKNAGYPTDFMERRAIEIEEAIKAEKKLNKIAIEEIKAETKEKKDTIRQKSTLSSLLNKLFR